MLVAATQALASQSPALKNSNKGLLPDVEHVRELSVHIARAVIRQAVKEGLAQEKNIPGSGIDEADREKEDRLLNDWIRDRMWNPVYHKLHRVDLETATGAARGLLGSTSSQRIGRV